MASFLLKLILTPTLISLASLAGRRWGPAISGWLVGLPLTSGPIIFFIVLAQGPSFARATAIGTLSGALSQALFCLVYAHVAARWRWPVATSAGVFAFFIATVFFQSLTLPVEILFAGVMLAANRQRIAYIQPPVHR